MEDKYPKGGAEILPTVGYMDDSLRQFFAAAEKSLWYSNTLFVITGDHTFKGFRPEFENELGDHRIPLILFSPKWEEHPEWKPNVDASEIVSQIDIMPTILDFLDIKTEKRNPLGRSVFWQGPRAAVFFEDGKYHLIQKDHFATSNRGENFQEFSNNDVLEKNPKPLLPKDPLALELKAIQQYFFEALTQNKIEWPNNKLKAPYHGDAKHD
jgi:phosphoglycerol transferase MdoB-like AlkP superfamily enzyme